MKRGIRKELLRKRDELSPVVRSEKASLIRERLLSLPEFINAETVLFYASFRSEVETLDLIRESLQTGKKIVLPKVDRAKHMLMLYEIRHMGELTAGYMGIPEPVPGVDRLRSMEDIDLAIVPGAGFDVSGNRLGYGGGYYDILLAESRRKIPLIALAYEEQIVDAVAAEEHDVKVDIIVTDRSVIRVT